jgi:hypothetical protein
MTLATLLGFYGAATLVSLGQIERLGYWKSVKSNDGRSENRA